MTHTQTQGADGAGPKTAAQSLDLRDLHAANIARQAEWCPDQVPDLSFRGNELGGECGEAQNVIKKLERERQGWRGSRATKDDLADELADVVICADLCAVTADIDLGAAVRRKFNATSEKQGLSVFLPIDPAALATPRTDSAERTAGEDGTRALLNLTDGMWRDAERQVSLLERHIDRSVTWRPVSEAPGDGTAAWIRYKDGTGITVAYLNPEFVESELPRLADAWAHVKPDPSSPGVPDSVRALSEAATPGRWEAGDGRANGSFNYVYSDDATGSAIATFALSHVYRVEKTTRANAQFAAAAVNFVRSLISAHPAGQSTGQGAEPIAEDFLRRADVMAACAEMADHTADMALYGDPEHAQRREAMEATATRLRAMFQHMPAARPAPDTHLTGPVGVEHAQLISDLMDFHDALNGGVGNGAITIRCESETDQTRRNFRAVLREAAAALAARPAAPEAQGAWHWTDRDGHPVRDAERGEQWLLTWSEASATYDINCIDGDWPHGDAIKLLCMDAWKWIEASPPAPPSSGQGGR